MYKKTKSLTVIVVEIFIVICLGAPAQASSWEIETIDPNVGLYTMSLSIDASDNSHIAYFVLTGYSNGQNEADLKYANNISGWTIETVEQGYLVPTDPARYLAVDSAGKPHIAYPEHNTSYQARLKYATKDSGWSSTYIVGPSLGPYDATAGHSLALDSNEDPYFASRQYWDGPRIYDKYGSLVYPQMTPTDKYDIGFSLDFDSSDRPHVAYAYWEGGNTHHLAYGYYDGADWQTELIDLGTSGIAGDAFMIVLDSSDKPHISYVNHEDNAIKYAYYDGASWNVEAIHVYHAVTGSGAEFPVSIALDDNDKPHMSFSDNRNSPGDFGKLYYAEKTGSSWVIQLVDDTDSPGHDLGFCNSIALDSRGIPHIAYSSPTQWQKSGYLKYAYLVPDPEIYVDADATGAGNGSSWDDAYNYLQDALIVAGSNLDVTEIRVAQGTYKPDQGSGIDPNDRTATFQLINGVEIRGGYAGYGEADPDARDIDLYETILSGDISEDPSIRNSYTLVTGSGTEPNAILDGFTISHGYSWDDDASGKGGGMYNDAGSPTVINCTFWHNSAANYGGGIYNTSGSSPIITNCYFEGNGSYRGGAMYNIGNSNPIVTNCTFYRNSAQFEGGGMYNHSSSPIVTNCTFSRLWAESGAGMRNVANSNPMINNSVFSENVAKGAGAIYIGSSSNVTLTNCQMSDNLVVLGGGGSAIFMHTDSTATLTNCTIANNPNEGYALYCYSDLASPVPNTLNINNSILWNGGKEIYNADGSTITINYSDVQEGLSAIEDPHTGVVWGAGNIEANPLFTDPDATDPNYLLWALSPCIDAGDNSAVPGGITTDLGENSRFVDDTDVTDTGIGTPPVVDMGAYERQVASGSMTDGNCGDLLHPYPSMDFDQNCLVDLADYVSFAGLWLECTKPECY